MSMHLSICLASSGMVSLSRTPSTFVLIGLNSPRILLGASGLGSQMSRWLGPPWRKQRMTDLALPKPVAPCKLLVAALALSEKNSGRLNPASPIAPTRMNSRRDQPSQHFLIGPDPGMDNMAALLQALA